jgi:hypothetical protein
VKKTLGFFGLWALIAASPALAQGWDAEGWYLRHGFGHQRESTIIFDDTDRQIIRGYIGRQRYYCPHGTLPEKRGGCMMPQPGAVIFYRPGDRLPETILYTPLPGYVVEQLAPPPPGAAYVRAGDDVYLIRERDRTVLGAINLFADLN